MHAYHEIFLIGPLSIKQMVVRTYMCARRTAICTSRFSDAFPFYLSSTCISLRRYMHTLYFYDRYSPFSVKFINNRAH